MNTLADKARKALEGATPGRWNILNSERFLVRDSVTFGTIASMGFLTKPNQGPRRDYEEVRSNARLIALAPDLARAYLDTLARAEKAELKAKRWESLCEESWKDRDLEFQELLQVLKERNRMREALGPFAEVLSRYTFAPHQLILLSEDNPKGRRLAHLRPEQFAAARVALKQESDQ